ncbi:MAG: hypothetical protein RBS82_10610 [Syntrophales bacterium]|jgi:hypothetical protein|nr:hypothetical protein [Syntrophales bacterium]
MRFNIYSAEKNVIHFGIILLCLAFIPALTVAADSDSEEGSLLAAARRYFSAEIRKDYSCVYESLSPSSEYKRSHSYKKYLEEALTSSHSISEYRIIDITYITGNEDRTKYPGIEKFAQIEVEVVLFFKDTGKYSEFNIGFIFTKEGGKWYKS